MVTSNPETVKERMLKIFDDAFRHNGFSEFRVEVRILKRQQKEVIIHYGRQYRYVLDFRNGNAEEFSSSDKRRNSCVALGKV